VDFTHASLTKLAESEIRKRVVSQQSVLAESLPEMASLMERHSKHYPEHLFVRFA
tara:strand:- start:46 stop:210 length:165 start_codon:yes stop_codon:yes gene_type:complete